MKINLEYRGNKLDGYINTSSIPTNDPDIVICDPRDINQVTHNQTVDEIVADNLITLLTPADIVQAVKHWCDKLKPNGTIKITFYDIQHLCRLINQGNIDLKAFHDLVFGEQYSNRSICDVQTIETLLKQLGMTIELLTIQNGVVNVEARRKVS